MKRLTIIRILAIAIPILIGWLAIELSHPQPSHNGRNVTQWLEFNPQAKQRNPFRSHKEGPPPAARHAIKAIGTNAIPTLLRMIQSKDSVVKCRLNALLDWQSIVHFRFPAASEQRAMGLAGFEILGDDAQAAAPALALLSRNSDASVRYAALESLRRIRPDNELIVPVLLQA